MLTHLHATLSEMFRHRPALAAELLGDVLGVTLPSHGQARLSPTEVAGVRPTELHVDAVVLLEDAGRTVAAVIVEVQLRPDDEKRWTWPVYLASVRRRVRCPTVLLVVCPDRSTARWAAAPIDLGHGSVVRPAVLGPDLVPVVSDSETATRAPELAVLSALAHADDQAPGTLDVLVEALTSVSPERAVDYASLVLEALPAHARAHLEDLLSTQPHIYDSYLARRFRAEGEAHGRAQGEAHGRAEGEARGRAAILLRILDRRSVVVTEQARARILDCSDLGQLETWSDRALTATTLEDVLAGP